ncbi:MAG TPA: hypothetical protein DCM27_07580 [Rhodospirillaceae bacterium]|nr:hypothetical protein [Rhodospirillaceae bacterium]
MNSVQFPSFLNLGTGPTGRWKLWALFCFFALVASVGTWMAGQYQIGQLDSLKGKYEQPIMNYAKYYGDSPNNSLERDLLEGCKQAQIGSWLQTTDALRFDNPLTGNRVGVQLDISKAYIDLNGREMSECVHDEVEDRQFDISSMTNTWAVILLLGSFCLGAWSWICRQSLIKYNKGRNIYAETLAAAAEVNQPQEPLTEPVTTAENLPEPPPEQKS